jgi:multisubunit Na+/H+ antiporter MnhB subunit
MKSFINKIQDRNLIQGLVIGISFITFSIALTTEISKKFSILYNILPYLSKFANLSLFIGIAIIVGCLFLAFLTLYSPVDKKSVAFHIRGRIKGVLYDA